MSRITHREYEAWISWLELEQNRPNRSDHYLMQIAAEIRRGNVKPGVRVGLDEMRLQFTPKFQPVSPEVQGRARKLAKLKWKAFAGPKLRVIRK